MITTATKSKYDIQMRLIPAGKFQMGAIGWGQFEHPVHTVFIDDFHIDRSPVTNLEFSEFVKQTNYQTSAELEGAAFGYIRGEIGKVSGLSWKSYFTKRRSNHPVVLVSWHDATAFAEWAEKRLPTEAEWEKAARGSLHQKLYPWGNAEPTDSLCNFGKQTTNFPPTTPIKSFPPNNFGLFDMAGNVWNWCADSFSEDFYSDACSENPCCQNNSPLKVRRGASFNIMQPFRLRCANRGAYISHNFAINLGFRCVKNF